MNIVAINLGNFGSTGTIMRGIASCIDSKNVRFYCAYPWDPLNKPAKESDILIGGKWSRRLSIVLGRITGFNGCFSYLETKALLRKLDRINPSIIHLHNLHNCYINLPMLFNYIKKNRIRTVWTLHDCWAMTGQCPHFTMVGCDKWKTGCYACKQYLEYPQAMVDRTETMWKLKKAWFTGVEDMTIVTPSQWLADLVSQSYLKEYPVKVINNGINLNIFMPTVSSFRSAHGIADGEYMVLGVAFGWGVRKGLDVFIDLAEKLGEQYKIVLVGTDESADAMLPENIISIHRTQNQKELAEIYSAADVFVNPTREENYPTVNMEALACGTPVLTFNTGGSPEIVDETCGCVVACDDVDGMKIEIERICTEKSYSREKCIVRSKGFDMNDRYMDYIKLYLKSDVNGSKKNEKRSVN